MKRVGTFTWTSAAPTAVDEELAIYDDGTAWLAVRRPRSVRGPIGTFRTSPEAGDLERLRAAGPGPVAFDVVRGVDDPELTALFALANRVSDLARATPQAVATFQAGGRGGSAGAVEVSLIVLGDGERPVEFELDPARCTVHFSNAGQPVAWFPMPALASGFVTQDFEGLGGLRMRAKVPPGELGAIAFDVPRPGNATAVSIEVAGRLAEALPDQRTPEPFAVRTEDGSLAG